MPSSEPTEAEERSASLARTALGYLAMIGGTVALYYLIRSYGMRLLAPTATGPLFGQTGTGAQAEALLHVLLALLVVILTARALGWLFRRFHQPPVIGEILAGILLGPSLLGRVAPSVAAFVLPTQVPRSV
jgi:hypothetical protein